MGKIWDLVVKKSPMSEHRAFVVYAKVALDKLFSNIGTYIIQGSNSDGDQPHGDPDILPLAEAHPLEHQEANTTTTNHTDDRGHTYIDVPPVNGEGDERRQNLWNYCINDGLQTIRASSLQSFDWTRINTFD